MGFSGGGSNVTKAHTHDSTVIQDGGALAANVTQFGLTNGSILVSDGSNIQELGIGSSAEVLAVSGGTPAWIANTANPLIKVSKTFSDIAAGEMDIYTLPQDSALINVWADITTVFDISTGVTIGDAGDDNGFVEASDWTASTGLTDATRGAYVTSFKTMRSVSGTTAIKAYNFISSSSLSNGVGATSDISMSAGHVRCYELDVSSLPSPFTISSIGYTGNATIGAGGGSMVMGLYSDNSGVPLTLLCQTASTTPATGAQTIATTTTPAITHSGILWVATFATGTVDYPLGETTHTGKTKNMSSVSGYPTLPTTFALSSTGNDLLTLTLGTASTDTQGEVDFYLQVVD
jgi:hypothetical protein